MSKNKLNWDKLPESLKFLAAPAEKYGHYRYESNIHDYIHNKMTDSNARALRALRDFFRSI
jgi:hypothetical protein